MLVRKLFGIEIEDDQNGWMTVPKFTKHIQDTYKTTTTGNDITANWVHFRITEGHLPIALPFEGKCIEQGKFADTLYVRIHPDKKHTKQSAGRKPGSKNFKKTKKVAKHVSLLHRKDLLGKLKAND